MKKSTSILNHEKLTTIINILSLGKWSTVEHEYLAKC